MTNTTEDLIKEIHFVGFPGIEMETILRISLIKRNPDLVPYYIDCPFFYNKSMERVDVNPDESCELLEEILGAND